MGRKLGRRLAETLVAPRESLRLERTSPGLLGDGDRIRCPLIVSDEWRPWFAAPVPGSLLPTFPSAVTWLPSSYRRWIFCGRSRTSSIRRSADCAHRNLPRRGSASCGFGRPDRVAGVWESASVQDERRPRTCEAPAHMTGYAAPEAAAARSRFAGYGGVSMPRSHVGNCSILLIFGELPDGGSERWAASDRGVPCGP